MSDPEPIPDPEARYHIASIPSVSPDVMNEPPPDPPLEAPQAPLPSEG